jgi:excisionase family DNA binding protein
MRRTGHFGEVLTLDEAARYLRTTRKTLAKLLREGRIPGRRVGRSYRFLRVELAGYLAGREEAETAGEQVRQAREFLRRLADGLYEGRGRASDHDVIYRR